MATYPTRLAHAFGHTPAPIRRLRRIEGEAFIRSLEIVSLFLQQDDTALRRLLDDTPPETICALQDALLAMTYALDSAPEDVE